MNFRIFDNRLDSGIWCRAEDVSRVDAIQLEPKMALVIRQPVIVIAFRELADRLVIAVFQATLDSRRLVAAVCTLAACSNFNKKMSSTQKLSSPSLKK